MGSGWTTIGTVLTQADGRFEYNWVPAMGGIVAIQATWLGNRQYNGASSPQTSVVILPLYLVLLIVALVLSITLLMVVLFKTRYTKQSQIQPALPPEMAPSLNAS